VTTYYVHTLPYEQQLLQQCIAIKHKTQHNTLTAPVIHQHDIICFSSKYTVNSATHCWYTWLLAMLYLFQLHFLPLICVSC